jgi:hypothetical protein
MDESELLMRQLQKLAAEDSIGKKSDPRYSVYVIEVERLDPNLECDFYVGSTGNPVRHRFAQHVPEHKFAARIFRNSRARAKRLRWDMMLDLPMFHSKEAAEKGEGLVAKALHKAGWVVNSDRLGKD